MENIYQKQARELKEVRWESFKQGVFKERNRCIMIIKSHILPTYPNNCKAIIKEINREIDETGKSITSSSAKVQQEEKE